MGLFSSNISENQFINGFERYAWTRMFPEFFVELARVGCIGVLTGFGERKDSTPT